MLEATSMVNKFVLPLLLGMMGVFTSPFSTNSQTIKRTSTVPSTVTRLEKNRETAHDFSEEVDIPSGNLMVSATASTLTSSGQSFSLTFSTGGQGWCDSTTTFLLAPNDDGFDAYFEEFSKLTVEEREKITEDWEKGEYESVHFDSYVFSITGTSNVHDIYIPRSLTRNHIFNLDVRKLGVDTVRDWTNISSISIPKEVEEVYSDSFQNVPADMVFNVEFESRPEEWAEDWAHGATVNYGYEFPEAKAEPLSRAGAAKYGDEKQNFILGWYPRDDQGKITNAEPLVLEYKIKRTSGELSESLYYEFSPSTDTSLYECVGKEISDFTKSLYCDIELAAGEEIDFESVMLHNIFRTKTNSAEVAIPEPDMSQAYRIVPKQGFLKVYKIEDFINCTFKGLTTFLGYTAIDVNVNKSTENVYQHLKTNYYNANLKDIENGKLKIRYRLTSLGLCSFRIVYNDGGTDVTKDVKIVTPIPQYKLAQQEGNRLSFLIKNSDVDAHFNANNIRSVSFVGFYVSLDLMGAKAVIPKSGVITRFGNFNIMPYTEKVNPFDVNVFLIIVLVSYIALFVLGAVGLYFYLKNKYKNDEFRRMKTKSYIMKTALFLVGSTIVLFDIIFIALRGSVLNNAIVVFNPTDAFIIVLSVLSVVIIGYFIKYLVGVIKVSKERRRIIKLKLNEDVDDDGTK